MLTEQYLDKRLLEFRTKLTGELIEYIDLKMEPIYQMQQDISAIKECLLELVASFNDFTKDYQKLKREHNNICIMVYDHERILKKRKKPG